MNILLATPLYSAGHWDAGHFWLRALNQLGHAASIWDYRLESQAPPGRFDLSLVLKGQEITNPRDVLPGPRVVYWPDALDRTPGIETVLARYDRVYTCLRPTPPGMGWLPTGWDPDIHRRHIVQPQTPVMFIGTHTERKEQFLRAIEPNVICGNGWDRCRPAVAKWHEPARYLHDFVRTLSQAQILVNVHHGPVGLGRRFFEFCAVNFTLTDLVPGVAEVLGPDLVSRVGFQTPAEAREKVDYFLGHPQEREELWRAERQAIMPYTYREAARRILADVS